MKYLKLSQQNGIATLCFDRPDSSANIFDQAALEECLVALRQVQSNTTIEALLIRSAKPHIFVAGADIETMEGAAVAFVCRQLEVPLLHVRAISNWTGDRDRGEWNLGAAVDVVQKAVRGLMQP